MKLGYRASDGTVFVILSESEIKKALTYLEIALKTKFQTSGTTCSIKYIEKKDIAGNQYLLHFPFKFQEIVIELLNLIVKALQIENNLSAAENILRFIQTVSPTRQSKFIQ